MTLFHRLFLVAIAIVPAYSVGASGDDNKEHGSAQGTEQATSAAEVAEGEVRKIDKDNKKIIIKHGVIKSLDMPPMTMVFRVKDATILDKVQAGDKVLFKAEKSEGAIVVTEIQRAK
ncbi:MAG: copper-binding protein [Sterolibacterium sp.]|jgi:Cu/Ag efflux protein CusF